MNDNKPVILYDGFCNLCNFWARFIKKRDRAEKFLWLTLQSEEGQKIRSINGIPKGEDSLILAEEKNIYVASEAIIRIVRYLPFPWKTLGLVRILPVSTRDSIYHWIARNRYSWFGKRDECSIEENKTSFHR